MKAKIVHQVPMSPAAQRLLAEIPRFAPRHPDERNFVFTTTGGKRPFSGFAKRKADLDAKIAVKSTIPHWTLHDLRRTVRTRLSMLGVQPIVSELIIGHKQTGILAVYDLYRYEREKRDALQRWEEELMVIIGGHPRAPNIVHLHPKVSGQPVTA
jgi:integrase